MHIQCPRLKFSRLCNTYGQELILFSLLKNVNSVWYKASALNIDLGCQTLKKSVVPLWVYFALFLEGMKEV